MADIYYKIDTRFDTTNNSIGILVEGKSTSWVGLENFEVERVLDDSIFQLPIGDPFEYYCWDEANNNIKESNERDRTNYSNEVNEQIDTRGTLFVPSSTFFSDEALSRMPNTNATGYFMLANSSTSMIGSIRCPRDINLDIHPNIRFWYSCESDGVVGDDIMKTRVRVKYAHNDSNITVNSGGSYDEIFNHNKEVSLNAKNRNRVQYDLDRDLIQVQDSIDIEFIRLGNDPLDTRAGRIMITGIELVYTKKIPTDNE